MQPVVGVICEYNPFHNGHARHFQLIRARLPGAAIVCVMSGPCTQRGEMALLSPALRARCALLAGADMVVELPCAFAVREAEHFAFGGVAALLRLGCVTHVSFGCEDDQLPALARAAWLTEKQPERLSALMREPLASGLPFAAAQGSALERLLLEEGFADAASLTQKPNNILAISYLRALLRLGGDLLPLPVPRAGDYHAGVLADAQSPSAMALRRAMVMGEAPFDDYMPAPCASLVQSAWREGARCLPDALDTALLYRLRGMGKQELLSLPDCTEGLENRLYALCREATTREELLTALKTKRYSYARLSRLLAHALLGVTGELLAAVEQPSYLRLLGFRERARDLLAGCTPLVSKPARGPIDDPLYQLDVRAYDLWALGAR
ncbi:MAG: hypothetical protein EOM69_08510, partial [Clostridia bacterium]|nr:hypothetical protein [Clostridia bacterium]